MYLDDPLIISDSKEICYQNTKLVIKTLQQLGFIINYDKSKLDPDQSCKFLGFLFNSNKFVIELPEDKIIVARQKILKILRCDTCKILQLAKILGYFISICPAFIYGWLYTKALERLKYTTLLKNQGNYNSRIFITSEVRSDLTWSQILSEYLVAK